MVKLILGGQVPRDVMSIGSVDEAIRNYGKFVVRTSCDDILILAEDVAEDNYSWIQLTTHSYYPFIEARHFSKKEALSSHLNDESVDVYGCLDAVDMIETALKLMKD